MNLSEEDKKLLRELCKKHEVSYEKIMKMLSTEHDFELRERRTGIYDALREIIIEDTT